MVRFFCCLPLMLLAACAGAPRPDPPDTSALPALVEVDEESTDGNEFPAGTPIRLELRTPISSATAKVGDRFELQTRTRFTAAGQVVVPDGLSAYGEVIHADERGMFGKPGELLVKLRSFQWQGRDIPLRNQTSDVGKDNRTAAVVVTQLFGLFGLFVTGGNAEIPPGSIIFGLLAEPLRVDPESPVPETETTD